MSKTVNSLGWHVELYTKQLGWQPVTEAFDSPEEAEKVKEGFYLETNRDNLRVYEALS